MAHSPSGPRVFVVYAPADVGFVEGFLLKAVGLAEHEVLRSSKLDPGSVIVRELAFGARSSVTVVVASPAFLASPWAQFASELAAHHSVEAGDHRATLIPVILSDCDLPLLSQRFEPLDFRNPQREQWEAEAAKLRKRLSAAPPVETRVGCPYPGMRPFREDEAAYFHGRDQEVANLQGRLRDGRREVYVIGPSGSGKSSLVIAGLVPSLRSLPELSSFAVRQLRPGVDPTAALAYALEWKVERAAEDATRWLSDAVSRQLASHPDQHRLLIVVDQLEELFTTAKPDARAAFIEALRGLRGDPRVTLILTLRADFYGALMESNLWADLDGQLTKLEVGPLRGVKLRAAIEGPARTLGVYFEPVLIERLLRDVAHEPGALPLLQDVLLVLWARRTRGLLRLEDYVAMSESAQNGLAVTVARRADDALSDLSPARREIARRVLLRLVQFGDDVTTTRRQQPRAALATADDAPEDIDAVVRHLADHRLVTTSGGANDELSARVDLAHEVLLSAWPALGKWIRDRRHDEQRRRVLEAKAAEWVDSGRGLSRLLDAEELHETRSWLTADKARDVGVSKDIERLLDASEAALAAREAEVAALRRGASEQMRRANEQEQRATREALLARRQLVRNYLLQGAALLMNDRAAQAAPYLLAAREAESDDVDAGVDEGSVRSLFGWAVRGLPLQHFTHGNAVRAVAFSPDGRRVATASEDKTARVWDAASGEAATPALAHAAAVVAVAFSPDGQRVATASNDKTARVWDAASGTAVTPALAHGYAVSEVAFSPDGRRVATASDDNTAGVWDAVSGKAVTPALAHGGWVAAVAFSPDGRRVATASLDNTARVWDAASGKAVTPALAHGDAVVAVAFSPDGQRVATASEDKTARVWDAASGTAVTPALAHGGWVKAVAFSPDGRRVATASGDNTARVWDAASGQEVTPALTHGDAVDAVAFSPDGRCLATVSADDTARVWDAATGQEVTPALAHRAAVSAVAFSPDGGSLATASWDKTARVWDAATGHVKPALAHEEEVVAVAFSPDGRRLATASWDKTARVWDAATGKAVTPALEHEDAVTLVLFSPDGRRLATASRNTARVWDAATGKAVTPALAHGRAVATVAFSPDGRRLATASDTVRVWDAATGEAVTPALAHGRAVATGEPVTPALARSAAVAFSPDGRQVATASRGKMARLWDAATGALLTPALAHGDRVLALAFSPDGRRVATASRDKTARVWDAATGNAVTPALEHGDAVEAVVFSPDERRVATAGGKTARVWDAATGNAVTPTLAHRDAVEAVAFSPDGRRVATASRDKTARVWDAATGQQVTPTLAHRDVVRAVAFSPDGRRVATASHDKTARVWDLPWDTGTLADWRAALEHCDYRLTADGVLVPREPPHAKP